MSEMTYTVITTHEEALTYINSILPNWVAIDIETAKLPEYAGHKMAGLHPTLSEIRLVQVCEPNSSQVYIFDVRNCGLAAIKQLVETKKLVAHNGKFEESFFRHNGMKPLQINCTMIMAHVLAYPKTSLADMLKKVFSHDMSKEQQKSEWGLTNLTEEQLAYAADDAYYLAKLAIYLRDELSAKKLQPAYQRFHKAQTVSATMELHGIPFDKEAHQSLIQQWEDAKAAEWQEIVSHLGDTNPKSTKQMDEFFRLSLPKTIIKKWPLSEKSQLLKMDATTLTARKDVHPVIPPLLRWKMYEKLTSTYGNSIQKLINPVTNNLHPSFRIFGARTGRFSSNQPNIQNPPREAGLREMIKAPPGYILMDADFSQVELRIAATMAQDVKMLRAYHEGKDLHTITAASTAGVEESEVTKDMRQKAKAVNFGLIYGAGAKTLQSYAKNTYGVEMTLNEAKEAKTTFLETYPDLARWQENQSLHASTYMYAETASGYRRQFVREGLTSDQVYTVSMNTPVQGTGAEILIESLAHLHANLHKFDARILAHIHDEILLMVREDQAEEMALQLQASMLHGYTTVLPNAPTTELTEVNAGPIWEKAMPLFTINETAQGGEKPKNNIGISPPTEPEVSDSDIANAFRFYQEMGYSLIAFNQNKKGPNELKHRDWQHNPTTSLPSSSVNIGLIHGLSQTVSLDADNLEKTRLALAGFGIDLDEITANAPTWWGNPNNRRKYLFKLPTTNKKLSVKKLQAHGETIFELRGTTNGGAVQDVLPPSIHPDLKTPYQWETPLVPQDQLPLLPAPLLEIWEQWDTSAPGLKAMLGDITPTKMVSNASSDTIKLIEAFNAKYPVTNWLEPHGYTKSRRPNAYLCPASSTGLPGVIFFPEENIVFSHHGSDPLNAEHDARPHDSFDCFRILNHGGDWKLAFEEAANLLGMEAHYSEPTQEELQQYQTAAEQVDPDSLPEAFIHAIPGERTKQIMQYILDSSPRQQPILALGGTLAALSAGTRNNYETPTGLRLNLMNILAGNTGRGKNNPLRGVNKLLGLTTNPITITGKPASGQAWHALVAREKQLAISVDEFGMYLKAALHEKAAPTAKQAADFLVEVFTAADDILPGKAYANAKDNIPAVEYPYIVLAGATTATALYEAIGKQQIHDGTFNRFLFFEATEFKKFNRNLTAEKKRPPQDLLDWFSQLAMGPINPSNPYGTHAPDQPYMVRFTPEAEEHFDKFSSKADHLVDTGDILEQSTWIRAYEMGAKVASLIAIAVDKDAPVVDETVALWAIQFMEYQIGFVANNLAAEATENDRVAHKNALLEYIADAKKRRSKQGNDQLFLDQNIMPYRLIAKKFRDMDSRYLKILLSEMVESGEILVSKSSQIEVVQKSQKFKGGGKVGDVYIATVRPKRRKSA